MPAPRARTSTSREPSVWPTCSKVTGRERGWTVTVVTSGAGMPPGPPGALFAVPSSPPAPHAHSIAAARSSGISLIAKTCASAEKGGRRFYLCSPGRPVAAGVTAVTDSGGRAGGEPAGQALQAIDDARDVLVAMRCGEADAHDAQPARRRGRHHEVGVDAGVEQALPVGDRGVALVEDQRRDRARNLGAEPVAEACGLRVQAAHMPPEALAQVGPREDAPQRLARRADDRGRRR